VFAHVFLVLFLLFIYNVLVGAVRPYFYRASVIDDLSVVESFKAGFKVVMSAVAADGLGEEWLGREFTPEVIEQLCHLHDTCYVCTGGEGGEFETLVVDAPFFKKRIVIDESETYFKLHAGSLIVTQAHLEDK